MTDRRAQPRYQDLQRRSDRVVRHLLAPERRAELEAYRFSGSTNRVYRVPLDGSGDFVVLKLPPGRLAYWPGLLKGALRNLLYGESEVTMGRDRTALETARYREWEQAGLSIPLLLDSPYPHVRVLEGLPYPTFYTILSSPDVPDGEKLGVLECVTRSLSDQHAVALQMGSKGLVHPYPGPWNIMFDAATGTTYWYDLEHPAEYPRLSIEDLMVRGLRIYLNGVLDHLAHRMDDVVAVVVANYGHPLVLRRVANSLLASRAARAIRLMNAAGLKKRAYHRRQRLAAALNTAIEASSPA